MPVPEGRANPLAQGLDHSGGAPDMTRDGRAFASRAMNVVSHPWSALASDLSQDSQIATDAPPLRGIAEAPDGKVLVTSTDNVAWMMDTDGSQRTRFADVEPVFEPASCGRFVLFRIDHEDSAIVRFDLDGLNPTVLVHGEIDSPTCSPDQTAIFSYSWNPPQKLWKVPLEGGPPQSLGNGLGDLLLTTIDVP